MVAEVDTGNVARSPILHRAIGVHVVLRSKVFSRRMVGGGNGPSHCEMSRRIGLAREHIGHRVASFLSRLPSHKDGIGTVAPRSGLHYAARVDNHDDGFAGCTEDVAHAKDHLLLVVCEVELAFYLPVHPLAGLPTYGDDGRIGQFGFGGGATLGYFYLIKLGLSLIEKPHHGILVGLEFGFGILYVVLVNLGELRCGAHSDILEPCHHIHHVGHVDTSRAQTTRKEVVAVHSEEGHGLEMAYG